MTETEPLLKLDHHLHDRLFEQRTIVLSGPLGDENTLRLCSALLVLAADDQTADIRLLINSPGGSVPGMLAIRDCMRAIPNDVSTINLGMAYSAGQFLLSFGARGKRYTMPHGRVLLHQGSAGIGGTAMDIAIQADDLRNTRDTVLACIAEDTGQSLERIEADSRRDRWFGATEALEYGFVDAIVEGPELFPAPQRRIGLGAS
ncbi:MAG: ATP-dependent Clp protease proteolytic subunit [Actinobacteria bacterium]|nr:ATP-dependent Clp protease proteolytic subunit [Actinomycetota bacterium]